MTEGGYLVEITGGDFSTALEMTEGGYLVEVTEGPLADLLRSLHALRLVEMTFRTLHVRYLSL